MGKLNTYTPVEWEDYPATKTPITASNLNAMERGISAVTNAVRDIEDGATTVGKATVINQPNAGKSNVPVYLNGGNLVRCTLATAVKPGDDGMVTGGAVQKAISDNYTALVTLMEAKDKVITDTYDEVTQRLYQSIKDTNDVITGKVKDSIDRDARLGERITSLEATASSLVTSVNKLNQSLDDFKKVMDSQLQALDSRVSRLESRIR